MNSRGDNVWKQGTKRRVMFARIAMLGSVLVLGFYLINAQTKNVLSSQNGIGDSRNFAERIVIPVPRHPSLISPQTVISSTEKLILLIPFSRLLSVDDNLKAVPDLVEKWSLDLSTNTYTFNLRDDVYFHNGTKVTSNDVLFSVHMWTRKGALDNHLLFPIEGAKEFAAGRARRISGLKVINDREFQVKLLFWSDTFLQNLALPRFVVFPNNFAGKTEKAFFKHPIGTGPYRVKENTEGKSVFEAHPSYHHGQPVTNVIELVVRSEAEAVTDYQSGRVNNLLFYNIKHDSWMNQEENVVLSSESLRTFVLVSSLSNPSLQQQEQRKRIFSFVRQNQLVKACFPTSQSTNHIIPEGIVGSKFYEKRTSPKESSEKSEGDMKTTPVTLHIPKHYKGECLRDFLTGAFRDTNVKVRTTDFNEMFRMLKSDRLELWVEYLSFKTTDPLSTLQYFSSKSNEFFLRKPVRELERMFDLVESLGHHERARYFSEIDNFLVQNYYVKPLVNINRIFVHRKNLEGVAFLKSVKFSIGWHRVRARKGDKS